jgi:CRP/FNR family transcriptional regulator
LTFKDNVSPSPSHLFNIGQFYLKQKSYKHAVHVFQKFIKHYPDDHNASSAIKELDAMKAPHIVPEDISENKQMIRKYEDNSIIFSEFEPGDELYIIQQGKVKITKIINEEILLTVLNPGDIFGEMAIKTKSSRSCCLRRLSANGCKQGKFPANDPGPAPAYRAPYNTVI